MSRLPGATSCQKDESHESVVAAEPAAVRMCRMHMAHLLRHATPPSDAREHGTLIDLCKLDR